MTTHIFFEQDEWSKVRKKINVIIYLWMEVVFCNNHYDIMVKLNGASPILYIQHQQVYTSVNLLKYMHYMGYKNMTCKTCMTRIGEKNIYSVM
jgi:hypothetical protein